MIQLEKRQECQVCHEFKYQMAEENEKGFICLVCHVPPMSTGTRPSSNYSILECCSKGELQVLVQQFLDDGYKLAGGVAINGNYYAQAVYK